jgi:hypothetical protein
MAEKGRIHEQKAINSLDRYRYEQRNVQHARSKVTGMAAGEYQQQ